ncbi:MAG: PP2C family protein-serine/threonine phosphatase [Candidatus Acidiferrales bacterium]
MATMALEITNDPEAIRRRILIADDQPDVLEALRLLLKGHGYTTEAVASPTTLLEALARREFDLILMDLNYARDTTSGREGLDLLAQLNAMETAPPIVVMTGWASVGLAVEAMQHGVGDFVEKPWVNTRLLEILQKQIDLGRVRREARRLAIVESKAQTEIAHQLHEQEREIREARAIQEGFLPKEIPQLTGYEIAGTWQPARTVGGDYFDFLAFDDRTLGFCIGDVAGKGMPAAMLMSNLQAGVRGLAGPAMPPEILCARLNSLVCHNIANDRFITFFYAQLDGPSRQLRYVNAGHNAPIVFHRDGSHARLREGGGVLGVFQTQEYALGTKKLAPGDRVVLFTDGVTEASDSDDVEYGESRLLSLLDENRGASAVELQRKILTAAADFCHGIWHDDATLIVIAVE